MSLNRRVLVYMVLMMTSNVGCYVRGALKGVFGGPRHGV